RNRRRHAGPRRHAQAHHRAPRRADPEGHRFVEGALDLAVAGPRRKRADGRARGGGRLAAASRLVGGQARRPDRPAHRERLRDGVPGDAGRPPAQHLQRRQARRRAGRRPAHRHHHQDRPHRISRRAEERVKDARELGFGTRAVHAGQSPDPTTGAVMTPIYYSSTYAQSAPGVHKGFEYSRSHNLTRYALEANLAALEGGAHGLAFASGLAATATVLHLLSAGDHIVAGDDLYGGTFRIFERVFRQMGLAFTYVDPAAGPAAF